MNPLDRLRSLAVLAEAVRVSAAPPALTEPEVPPKVQALEIQAQLKKAGIPTDIQWRDGHAHFTASSAGYITLRWGVRGDKALYWAWEADRSEKLPGASKDYAGEFPLRAGDVQRLPQWADGILAPKILKRLVKEAKAAFDKIQAAREETKTKAAAAEGSAEDATDNVWSVVTLGKDHGYATEVDTFASKDAAVQAAKERGGVYVVKGTQMWNEPLGQVEEHDKPAWTRYFP